MMLVLGEGRNNFSVMQGLVVQVGGCGYNPKIRLHPPKENPIPSTHPPL
tara:strand:+ start:3802 stop:3948 length:147 start_codon:yes stop_codon:yes gene_type:complete